jgi:uncharacterized protein (TIGR03790 family)
MKLSLLKPVLSGWLLLLTVNAFAAPSGDEVAVVFNKNVPASEKVARHYAAARQVPDDQIIGLALSEAEEMSRVEYDSALAGPLVREFETRRLWVMPANSSASTNDNPAQFTHRPVASKIRYLVLCYGVPLKIRNEPELHEPGEDQVQPELRVNAAAVDSELSVLPTPMADRKCFGVLGNPFYTTTNATAFNPTNGILLVARLDGPKPEIAMGLVDKAIMAETNGLWGHAYGDIRSITDTNYVLGDQWIKTAYDICHVLGFESHLDTNAATIPASFPMPQIAFYAGWYDGDVSGPFLAPHVEFMPGAFAYHLHSANANSIRTTNRFWVGPLLAKGVTCTLGSVNEPYLMGTPDIGTFAARWLISGFTFGEAAYAAQGGLSWQTTVIGDPLYRAFAMPPQLLHLKLERLQSPLLAWSHLRIVNMNIARGVPLMSLIAYLEGLELTRHSSVLMEKLGDLNAAVGKPASTIDCYQKALALDPSPQQELGLMLKLGQQFMAQHRNREASDLWHKLLSTFPDYPGKSDIAVRLLKLDEAVVTRPATNAIDAALRELEESKARRHAK